MDPKLLLGEDLGEGDPVHRTEELKGGPGAERLEGVVMRERDDTLDPTPAGGELMGVDVLLTLPAPGDGFVTYRSIKLAERGELHNKACRIISGEGVLSRSVPTPAGEVITTTSRSLLFFSGSFP